MYSIIPYHKWNQEDNQECFPLNNFISAGSPSLVLLPSFLFTRWFPDMYLGKLASNKELLPIIFKYIIG